MMYSCDRGYNLNIEDNFKRHFTVKFRFNWGKNDKHTF